MIQADLSLAERLERIGLDAGLDAIGFTNADVLEPARTVIASRKSKGLSGSMNFTYRNPERSTDPARSLPTSQSLIAGAVGYYRNSPQAPVELSGRVARYSWRDHYSGIRFALQAIADELISQGYRAQVHCDGNSLVDRNVAYRAGLGWYGKNANLLLPNVGSWFVLGAVLTDAVLPPAATQQVDQCGPCQRCFEGCPTSAIVGPGIIDARRCLAWLVQAEGQIPLEFREAVGDRIYGCDECQDVCPPNKALIPSTEAEEDSDPFVSLMWILEATDEQLMKRVGRWYIARRDPAVVRRTALVNLGNTAEPGLPGLRPILQRYLQHENPLLRGHAVWACRRLGMHDLVQSCQSDPDASVRSEVNVPVQSRFDTN